MVTDKPRRLSLDIMWWFIASLYFLAPIPSWAAAITPEITLTTDSDSVYLGDTVIIEMEAIGIVDTVDISKLFADADLLRETTGTRIAVIEERVVEVKLRRMEFLPRREGVIVFGPLQGDSSSGLIVSNQINMSVLPATNEQWQPSDDDLQINVTFSINGTSSAKNTQANTPYSAYIGQRIIVDIELRHQHSIADEDIVLPDFDGFDVLAEYERRRTIDSTTTLAKTSADNDNTEQWRVIEWRYHVFAQHSGLVKMDAVIWSGLAIRSRTQRAQFTKEGDQHTLQIKAALPDAKWWLPASDVTLDDSWSRDPRELSAGDEIFRTITLSANDVLASHLPDVQMLESRAISSTLVEHKRSQQLQANHIRAKATFKYRLVAQSPIPVFLDTVRVPWYDVSQSQPRESIIPARRINVGLPDRADLLAELALSGSWLDRISLTLQTAVSRFAYWHICLALLSIIACSLLFREIRAALTQRESDTSGNGSSALPRL